MGLVVYGMPVSSYCHKVRLALRLKGVPFEDCAPPGGYGSAEYRAIVPTGTIPAIDHDGFVLSESDAILEYVEEAFPLPALHPRTVQERARHRQVMRHHDTRFEPTIRALFPLVSPTGPREKLEELAKAHEAALASLASLVAPLRQRGPFLGGASPALADCAYPTSLTMGIDILAALGRTTVLPDALAAWHSAFSRHAIVANVMAEGQAALQNWLETRGSGRG